MKKEVRSRLKHVEDSAIKNFGENLVKILHRFAVCGTKAACSYLQHNTINKHTQPHSFPYSTVTMGHKKGRTTPLPIP